MPGQENVEYEKKFKEEHDRLFNQDKNSMCGLFSSFYRTEIQDKTFLELFNHALANDNRTRRAMINLRLITLENGKAKLTPEGAQVSSMLINLINQDNLDNKENEEIKDQEYNEDTEQYYAITFQSSVDNFFPIRLEYLEKAIPLSKIEDLNSFHLLLPSCRQLSAEGATPMPTIHEDPSRLNYNYKPMSLPIDDGDIQEFLVPAPNTNILSTKVEGYYNGMLMETHGKLKNSGFLLFRCFHRTNTDGMTFSEKFKHGLDHDNRTREAMILLGWIEKQENGKAKVDKDGKAILTAKGKEIYDAIKINKAAANSNVSPEAQSKENEAKIISSEPKESRMMLSGL